LFDLLTVVSCKACHFARICDSEVSSTTCPHCGKRIDVRRAVKHYQGKDRRKASDMVFSINSALSQGSQPGRGRRDLGKDAGIVAHGPKNRGLRVEKFLSGHKTFTFTQLVQFLGMNEKEGEIFVEKLERSGRILRKGKDTYECVY
jgi:predicted RNA-binding Zn-ribbon protein involved in translation (DUF1610 family)